mmetsp:Transcript_7641/g.10843  ORF Transcript_7641/g.10843 Transcript_7641/m.10843 type:complete len:128 (-) Transcript_7641:350-733(-)
MSRTWKWKWIGLINKNITLNNLSISSAKSIDWRNLQKSEIEDSFDVIFALECVYREDLYQPLISAILKYIHSRSVVFLGMTKQFTKPSFFELLVSSGLCYRMIPFEYLCKSNDNLADNIGLFVLYTY